MLSASSSSFFTATAQTLSPPTKTKPSRPPSSVRFATSARAAAGTAVKPPPPAMSVSPSSLYEVLGIPAAASGQEIKAAYRRLARVCHPDVAAVGRKDSSADEFMRIHAAYSTLSDPAKRADYDLRVLRRRPLSSAASAASVYNRRRNWETDQCW